MLIDHPLVLRNEQNIVWLSGFKLVGWVIVKRNVVLLNGILGLGFVQSQVRINNYLLAILVGFDL